MLEVFTCPSWRILVYLSFFPDCSIVPVKCIDMRVRACFGCALIEFSPFMTNVCGKQASALAAVATSLCCTVQQSGFGLVC